MTNVDVDAFTEIRDKFDSEPACEHADHGTDQLVHHGPAEWHVSTKCPGCGQSDRKLMCQGWYEFASSPMPLSVVHRECKTRQTVQEYFANSTWVKL